MLFFLIRHGDPIYDPDSLTPLGQRQAEAAARRLAVYGMDRIYASSSTRAQQTARPTAEILKKPVETLEWAHETLAWQQLTMTREDGRLTWAFAHPRCRELFRDPSVIGMGAEWYDHPAFAETQFREGTLRIGREADAFFAALGYRHLREENCWLAVEPTKERVALFAHQGFGLAFLSWITDIPYPLFSTRFDMSHSNFTAVEFAGEKGEKIIPRVLTLSNDSHIYREGLPTLYQNKIPL